MERLKGMENKKLIFVHSGWGAKIKATEEGPTSYKKFLLQTKPQLLENSLDIFSKHSSLETPNLVGKKALPFVTEVATNLAEVTARVCRDNYFPVIIGGDHSIAAGSWAGIIHAHKAAENFGLIWIDAHMDAHRYVDSPSKAYHGMPQAVLLGYGEPELVNIKNYSPKIKPEHLVVLGARSYEVEEEAFLKKLGVRIFYDREIKARGFHDCFLEASSIVSKNTRGFGISLDLDVFDPLFAPGVGSPEPNGLYPTEVLLMFRKLKVNEHLKGLEIVEYNPKRDMDNRTLLLLHQIVALI